jgi:hypothetical protein
MSEARAKSRSPMKIASLPAYCQTYSHLDGHRVPKWGEEYQNFSRTHTTIKRQLVRILVDGAALAAFSGVFRFTRGKMSSAPMNHYRSQSRRSPREVYSMSHYQSLSTEFPGNTPGTTVRCGTTPSDALIDLRSSVLPVIATWWG